MSESLSSSSFDVSGIAHQTTYPCTLEQNGMTDRKNLHLEITMDSLFTMHVPKTFWSKAVQVVTNLMNRIPSHVLAFKSLIGLLSSPSQLFPLPLRLLGVFILFMCLSLRVQIGS